MANGTACRSSSSPSSGTNKKHEDEFPYDASTLAPHASPQVRPVAVCSTTGSAIALTKRVRADQQVDRPLLETNMPSGQCNFTEARTDASDLFISQDQCHCKDSVPRGLRSSLHHRVRARSLPISSRFVPRHRCPSSKLTSCSALSLFKPGTPALSGAVQHPFEARRVSFSLSSASNDGNARPEKPKLDGLSKAGMCGSPHSGGFAGNGSARKTKQRCKRRIIKERTLGNTSRSSY